MKQAKNTQDKTYKTNKQKHKHTNAANKQYNNQQYSKPLKFKQTQTHKKVNKRTNKYINVKQQNHRKHKHAPTQTKINISKS